MRYDDDRLERLELLVEQLTKRVAHLEQGAPDAPAPPAEPAPPPSRIAAPPRPREPREPREPAAPPPAPRPTAPRRPPGPSIDLEDLLGGRVLAWAGALAVVVGIVFFLATAIRRGWIDEPTRVVLAYLGSTLLLAAGLYLYERKGQTQAAIAAVAAAVFGLFASTVAATSLYDLVEPTVGLAVAVLVGAVATAIAVRWDSREMAGIGIVGALLSPVLVDAGTSGVALAFMAVALLSATGVLLWRKWDWLAAAAFLTSAPQLAAWLADSYEGSLALALSVLAAFWVVYVVAAIGYELRVPTQTLRLSSGSLLLADAVFTAGAGWLMLDSAGHGDAATIWVVGAAAVHVLLGAVTVRGRISREIALLLLAVGTGLSAIGAALALDGPALVAAWSVEAVLLAWLARRTGTARGYLASAGFLAAAAVHTLLLDASADKLVEAADASAIVAVVLVAAAAAAVSRLSAGEQDDMAQATELVALAGIAYLVPIALEGLPVVLAWSAIGVALAVASDRGLVRDFGFGATAFVGLAAAHTLAFEAPPIALRDGVDDLLVAALAIAATAAAAYAASRLAPEPADRVLTLVAGVGAVYLPSIAIVDLTAAGDADPGQTPQVLLSSFWAACGLGALVAGLMRDDRPLRIAGLVLLAVAATKVVVYDLAELDEIYRVLSFIALGLLLLAGAFAYQRMRQQPGGSA